MKIGKQYIGKIVRLVWEGDPSKDRIDRKTRRLGRAGLAWWIEYGKIDCVVDGVVHLLHSEGYSPGAIEPNWDEAEETKVPEDLIVGIYIISEERNALHSSEPTS